MTINLWKPVRDFPLFPVFESLEVSSAFTSIMVWAALGVLTLLVLTQYRIQRFVKILILLFTLLILMDQMRLQPWVYSFVLLLLPFALTQDKVSITNYLRFLFAGMYIWSGIHKFNPYFSTLIFESILIDGLGITNVDLVISLKRFAFVVPIIEVSMGIFLLLKPTRKMGVILAVLTHMFILYYIVFGLRGNFVIIPWNLVMIYGLFFLFLQQKETLTFFQLPRSLISVLILVFLLPIGFLFDKVDQRVSFSMYDGKIKQLYFVSSTEGIAPENQTYLYNTLIEKGAILNFNALSYQELNVPFYTEDRFISALINDYPRNQNTDVILTRIPLWERNIRATYKSEKEIKVYYDSRPLPRILLKESFYIPKYQKVVTWNID